MQYEGRNFWSAQVTLSDAAQSCYKPEDVTSPYANNLFNLTVLVYCKNHEQYIVQTLLKILEAMKAVQKSYEIIVIDDGSNDSSIPLIQQFIKDYMGETILLCANRQSKGVAQNYVDAAFLRQVMYYFSIYGDNAEPMETLADIFKSVGDADVIAPYYVQSAGKYPDEHPVVRWYSKLLNLISRNRINEYAGMPVHLRHNIMRWHSNRQGVGFKADLLFRILDLGFTYKQLPCRSARLRYSRDDQQVCWRDMLSMAYTVFTILLRQALYWMGIR